MMRNRLNMVKTVSKAVKRAAFEQPPSIDRLDHHLLAVLSRSGRASSVELAEAIHLSPTAVARRQRALEDAGVIRGYSADINTAAFGFRTTVVVQISLKSQSETDLAQFEQAVRNCDSVLQCFLMSGTDDYVLTLLVRDLPDFERVHKTQLSRLPHIARIQSSFALREIVRRALPADMLDR
ncbi:MAG TPA: Lrp/AsnC family transcriptional regulator [Ramlibacter sp.]|nr:Lrp/AsnC family transcriptional regulator [Ramlibacter sp.]